MAGSRLLWAVISGFLSGVFARSILPIGTSFAYLALLLAAAMITCGFFERSRRRGAFILATAFIFFALGVARMDAAVMAGDPALTARLGERVTLIGNIATEPDDRDSGVRLSVQATALIDGTSSIPLRAGVLVEMPPHAAARYGDAVQVSGTLELPAAFEAGDGRQFDYPDYLASSGIAYALSFAELKNLGTNSGNYFESLAIDAKQEYLEGEDAVLPEPESGLAGGITVGDKRSIGPSLTTDFQKVSLIQMVVLSGYNITVVANFAARLLSWAPRYMQFGSGIFVVMFFMLISGGASSAVRAGLMALLAMYARTSGRTYDSLRALGVVALAMVAWNPFTLAFDPGFQLSALAMLGLAAGTPIFAARLRWVPERFALREIVASTMATQLAVLPLLLYESGQLSLLAVPANVLTMTVVPLAMLASGFAAVGGMVAGHALVPIALPAYALLSYIITVAHSLASLPFAALSIPAFSAWWLIIAYALLAGFFLIAHKEDAAET